ncbi:glycosyltransferase family A protein [soil metagenome]
MLEIGTVITTYNRANFLLEALVSVINQTVPPSEIIVVDDGGTDNSEAIVSRFSGVKYVRKENAGVASARNLGAKFIESGLIAFLDDDDLWLADKLEIQSEFLLRENLDLAFSHGDEFLEDQQNAACAEIRTEIPFISSSNMLVKREAFSRIGDFDERLRTGGELIDWYARAKDAGLAIGVCKSSLIKRRVHATNNSSSKTCDHTKYTMAMKQIIDRRRHANQK